MSFATRFICNQFECDRLRRNVHAWFLFTSASFISLLILSGVWHWNGCVNTEKGDLCMQCTAFCSLFGANQKWWMVWRFNDLYSGKASAEAAALHANCREMKIDFCQKPAAFTWKASTSIKGMICGVKGTDKGEVTLMGSPPQPQRKQPKPSPVTAFSFFLIVNMFRQQNSECSLCLP